MLCYSQHCKTESDCYFYFISLLIVIILGLLSCIVLCGSGGGFLSIVKTKKKCYTNVILIYVLFVAIMIEIILYVENQALCLIKTLRILKNS